MGGESAITPGPTSELSVRTRSGGNGTFGRRVGGELRAETTPAMPVTAGRSLEVADFDRDGSPEFVVRTDSGMSVFGQSGRAATVASTPQSAFVRSAIGDLNDDRIPDIVAMREGAASGAFIDGTDIAPALRETSPAALVGSALDDLFPGQGGTLAEIAVTDLDHDGHAGIVALLNPGSGLRMLARWARNVDVPTPERLVDLRPFPSNEAACFRLADLDGDGTPDFVGCVEQTVSVRLGARKTAVPEYGFLNQGNLSDHADAVTGAGGIVTSLVVADADGDGRPDLVCGLQDGRISVIANHRTVEHRIELGLPQVVTVGAGEMRIALGDCNGDGLPDIAAADQARSAVTVLISRRESNGVRYSISQVLQTSGSAVDVAMADCNGDGLTDIAVLTTTGIESWYGRGSRATSDGGFSATIDFAVKLKVGPVTDFDRDGIADLFALAIDQSFTPQTFLGEGYQGQGTGGFTFGPSSSVKAPGFHGLEVVDLDRDGEIDLVAAQENAMAVYLRRGLSFDASLVRIGTQAGAEVSRKPAFADVNRDRFPDLVFTDKVGNPHLVLSDNQPLPLFGSGTPTIEGEILIGEAPPLLSNGNSQLPVVKLVDATPGLPAGTYWIRVAGVRGASVETAATQHVQIVVEPNTSKALEIDLSSMDMSAYDGARIYFSTGAAGSGFTFGEFWRVGATIPLADIADAVTLATLPNPKSATAVAAPRTNAVAIADVNGDGVLDVAALDTLKGLVRFRIGDGRGNFAARASAADAAIGVARDVNAHNIRTDLFVQDLNGDGFADLIAWGHQASAVHPNGNLATVDSLGNTIGLSTDSDGDPILPRHGAVAVAFGKAPSEDGGAAFEAPLFFRPGAIQPKSVTPTDVDGDGLVDLVIAGSGKIATVFQYAPKFFSQHVGGDPSAPVAISATNGSIDTLSVLELNGDGLIDALSAQTQDSTFKVVVLEGSGTVRRIPLSEAPLPATGE